MPLSNATPPTCPSVRPRWPGLWIVLSVAVLGTVALLRTQFVLAVVVGESMLPTVKNGALLVVSRTAYRTQAPVRGDVVLVRNGGELIVKRVVGVPGDELALRAGTLYMNGSACPEPYCGAGEKNDELNIGEAKLCDDRFLVLGDNRTLPAQLFVYAVASRAKIIGKVVLNIPAAGHR